MQSSPHPTRFLFVSFILTILFCAGIGSAATSDHPVVSGISGPEKLNDGFGPTESYVFSATVSGGSPPYSYKWMNPPGIKTLYEGKEYSTVTIPAEQLYTSGTPRYGVWLTVTDSAGKDALWQREGGLGSSNQYFYGLDFTDYPKPAWSKITEPKTFPKAAAPAAKVTTTVTTQNTCRDSGARFNGIQGQVEVFSECVHGIPPDKSTWDWHFAQPNTILYVGDHVKTGEDSSAILGFADMSTFVLKQESEIVLASPPEKDSKLKLVAGNIWVNIKKIAEGGSVEVELNQAVCGIKGTTFVVSSDGKQSALQVIEGTVALTGKADGKTVPVTAGRQVTATNQGLGTATTFDPAVAQADWDAVTAKAASGTPSPTPAPKSGLEALLVLGALGAASTGVVFFRRR